MFPFAQYKEIAYLCCDKGKIFLARIGKNARFFGKNGYYRINE